MTTITIGGAHVSLPTIPAQTNASAGVLDFTATSGQYLFIRAYDANVDYGVDIIIRDSGNNIVFQTNDASPSYSDFAMAGNPYTVPHITSTGSYTLEVIYTNSWVNANSQPILVYIDAAAPTTLNQAKSFTSYGLVGNWAYRPVYFLFSAASGAAIGVDCAGVGPINSWEYKLQSLPWLSPATLIDNSVGNDFSVDTNWQGVPSDTNGQNIFWFMPQSAQTNSLIISGDAPPPPVTEFPTVAWTVYPYATTNQGWGEVKLAIHTAHATLAILRLNGVDYVLTLDGSGNGSFTVPNIRVGNYTAVVTASNTLGSVQLRADFSVIDPSLVTMILDFADVILDVGIDYGCDGGPTFDTQVAQAAGGNEQRNVRRAVELNEFELGERVISKLKKDYLQDFFRARRGKAQGFKFKNWNDFIAKDELVIADGRPFLQLAKWAVSGISVYGRAVYKPVEGFTLKKNGVAWVPPGGSIDLTTGRITLSQIGASATISGISNGVNGVITFASAPGFATGDRVYLQGFSGMDPLKNRGVTLTQINATSYSTGINTTLYPAYVSGGTATKYVAAGDVYTWTGEFYTPARFDTDKFRCRFEAWDEDQKDGAYYLSSLPVKEIFLEID